jgi:uncharacterized protein involved in cysteine biosynthesis
MSPLRVRLALFPWYNRLMERFHDAPEWLVWLVWLVTLATIALTFVLAIMTASYLFAGSPERCNASGVKQVLPGNSNTSYDYVVICNDGASFEH